MTVAPIAWQFPVDEAARVKLGASTQTPAPILCVLAADTSVTVRAAVAMNAEAPALADRTLTQDGDERVRALLARKLASLAPFLDAAERNQFQDHALSLLASLVEDEAVRVRAAITDIVKDMPEAPRTLILRLAADTAMPVAEPVIRLSPLLTQEDLLALLTTPPAPDTVKAIARRPYLSELVSDAIAATADTAAIRALLANGSASIREATLDALIARAAKHLDWHEPLVHRPMLPAPAARALSEIVTTHLLELMTARADLDPCVTAELRHRLAARAAAPPAEGNFEAKLTSERAYAQAQAAAADGALSEDTVLRAAQRGEARLASAMLAVATGVPLSVVERAASLRSAKGLVSLCWKAGFSMRVAGPLQSLLARIPPASILAPGPNGMFPMAAEEMRWQLEFLDRMGC